MGKRRKATVKRKNEPKLASAVSEDEDEIEQRLESLLDDEIDNYNDMKDKQLLQKAKSKTSKGKSPVIPDEEEEEVYGLGLTSSDEDEDEIEEDSDDDEDDSVNDDDILGAEDEDDGIPDSRAWGKKSRVFHSTDYVDQDFGGMEDNEAELAEQEEAEAKEIRKRLTAEMDESDFLDLLPIPSKEEGSAGKETEGKREVLKMDVDKLTPAEKRKMVERECPEVAYMIDDLKEKMNEAPEIRKLGDDASDEILKSFYRTKYHTIMNYCMNISYYLYLRAKNPSNCKGHPVLKRILQFSKLIEELDTFNVESFSSPTVPEVKQNRSQVKVPKKHKQPEKVKKLTEKRKKVQFSEEDEEEILQRLKAKEEHEEELDTSQEADEKRGISYAMAKNKGLTPKRKKEQRNPRVKHREKFRKAKIRRKGQVRGVRTETERYGGEISGIKAHLTKSIKLN